MSPTIGIAIPVYGHSGLVSEAIHSALQQNAVIVAVNDGCPDPETRRALHGWRSETPDRFHVVEQPNRGLSAARNTATRFLYETYPALEAVFYLDADNRLDAGADRVWSAALSGSDADWFYPNFDMFGLDQQAHAGGPFSVATLSASNICEAGSLVRRRVYDAGVRFDEGFRDGYEDWDFFLSAAEAGFRGEPLRASFFRYRKRPVSMLATSHELDTVLRTRLRSKHDWLYRRDTVAQMAAREWPRIALIEADLQRCVYLPHATGTPVDTDIEDVSQQMLRAHVRPDQTPRVGFVAIVRPGVVEALSRHRVLASAFWHLQTGSGQADLATLRLDQGPPGWIEVSTRDKAKRPVHPPNYGAALSAAETRAEHAFRKADREEERTRIADADIILVREATFRGLVWPKPRSGVAEGDRGSPTTPLERASATSVRMALAEDLQRLGPAPRDGLSALVDRIRHMADPMPDPRAPWRQAPQLKGPGDQEAIIEAASLGGQPLPVQRSASSPRIGFVVPLFHFGGVEKCVSRLASALSALGARPFLFVYGDGKLRADDWMLAPFEAVHVLPSPDIPNWDGPRFMGTAMAEALDADDLSRMISPLVAMDAVVSTGWPVLGQGLAALRAQGIVTLAWEHLVETSPYGLPYGSPYLALGHEGGYDLILTCSDRLATWLAAMGVPRTKILALPNGPGFPQTAGIGVAPNGDRKPGVPLRVGFIGRFDRQKGADRFIALARRCRDLPIEFSMTGGAVLGQSTLPDPADGITLHPPATSPDELTAAFARIDILILPSRDEGLPLTVLEAFRAGVVPIATDVGAVSDVLEHEANGILIPRDGDPVAEIRDHLKALVADPARLAMLAAAAPPIADKWDRNAAALMAALAPLVDR